MSSEVKSLISAIKKGDEECVKQLLANGVDVNDNFDNQLNPLHTAALYNRPQLLRIMLDNGADVNSTTQSHTTALHIASENGNFFCVKHLLEFGCDVNVEDSDGNTALHLAIIMKAVNNRNRSLSENFQQLSAEYCKIIEILISQTDIDLTMSMRNGFDCVTFAITSDDGLTIERLLRKSPHLYYKKRDGHYPLHVATIFGCVSIVELMLDIVADADIRNDDGSTALHYAVLLRKPKMVEILVSKGAAVDCVDNDNNTALHFAMIQANEELQLKTVEPISIDDSSLTHQIMDKLMNARIKQSISLAIAGYLIQEAGADYLHENRYGLIPLDMIRTHSCELRNTFVYVVIFQAVK